LVAVSVAAVWAFVAPSLRGTGTQFTKTQTCISNTVEPIECKATNNNGVAQYPVSVKVRRTLSDGVATLSNYQVFVSGASPDTSVKSSEIGPNTVEGGVNIFLPQQGSVADITWAENTGSGVVFDTNTNAKVTAKYSMPDNTIITCDSLPVACNK